MSRSMFFLLLLAFAGSALAANRYYEATVTRTAVHESNFGVCMAKVSPSPSDEGLNCKPDWVSFSCSGDFNSKEIGQQKLSAAQLALMTGDLVKINVDDTRKHNGYCYAQRIDNLAN
jgi:hypothetical protein